MKQKPRYRIIEERYTLDGITHYFIQKRVWFWWEYVKHGSNSLLCCEKIFFTSVEKAERYINGELMFKPYMKVIKEF